MRSAQDLWKVQVVDNLCVVLSVISTALSTTVALVTHRSRNAKLLPWSQRAPPKKPRGTGSRGGGFLWPLVGGLGSDPFLMNQSLLIPPAPQEAGVFHFFAFPWEGSGAFQGPRCLCLLPFQLTDRSGAVIPNMQALILLFSAWSSVQGGPGPRERLTSTSLGKAPSAAAVTM